MSENVATLDQALGRAAKLLRLLREEGLKDEYLDIPANNKLARRRLVRFWNQLPQRQVGREFAREIMGWNFFGLEENQKRFNIGFNLQELPEIPYTEDELRSVKQTHILILVFPISIREIFQKARELGISGHLEPEWFTREEYVHFSNFKGSEVTWQLVRKDPVQGSVNKSWKEQQKLLGPDEEVPSSRVLLYSVVGHYLHIGVRLFYDVMVRTRDKAPFAKEQLGVGFSDGANPVHHGLTLLGVGDYAQKHVGVASARKPSIITA